MAKLPPKVLIVEDHALVREGIAHLLSKEWPRCTIAECKDATEAQGLLTKHRWDLVVMDLHLPSSASKRDDAGFNLVASFAQRSNILLISADGSQGVIHTAQDLGCAGFVDKNEPIVEFLKAARDVVVGLPHFPRIDDDDRLVLSKRENQIKKALLEGKRLVQIAKALELSYGSVQTYKRRLFAKLGVSGLAEFFKTAGPRSL